MHSDDISLLVYIIQVGTKNKIKKGKIQKQINNKFRKALEIFLARIKRR